MTSGVFHAKLQIPLLRLLLVASYDVSHFEISPTLKPDAAFRAFAHLGDIFFMALERGENACVALAGTPS